MITTTNYEARIQQHAVFMQQKARLLIAFAATILFLCIENVKAFTAPLSKPDTLLFMASGAHSMTKRWKTKPSTLSVRQTTQVKHEDDQELAKKDQSQTKSNSVISRTHCNNLTCMKMAFNFGSTAENDSVPTLDMKTSLNAFGSWYNKMDPVARPPDYDEDDEIDYSLSSPADNWPSSIEEEKVLTSTTAYLTNPRAKNKSIFSDSKRPRPIRTIRKIAGWFLRSPAARNARGFGSQTYL